MLSCFYDMDAPTRADESILTLIQLSKLGITDVMNKHYSSLLALQGGASSFQHYRSS